MGNKNTSPSVRHGMRNACRIPHQTETFQKFARRKTVNFFNWPAICVLARAYPQLVLGLISLDLSSEIGQQVAIGIGSLFLTDRPTQGPVPWSLILNYRDSNGEHDVVEACARYNIPSFIFQYKDREVEPGSSALPHPNNLEYPSYQGGEFEWNNEKYVVMLSGAGFALDFVPAKCVDMSC